ncbi:hypothetical protein HPC49_09360 [Pyxidicoccus fallax]|uniref:Uncharacterized protein n=1 Tax=Pyxidicoccus fallax TaxID=394095 RepID=A0A848LG13_9BACT|nr:hypothetical protein [Pyxidicoccus fallax]NMO14658.1 hypothetical protein [Pyxidicoccus fallax]NPC78449.1 hypothetical protein [Pyxidicoccus fallax]
MSAPLVEVSILPSGTVERESSRAAQPSEVRSHAQRRHPMSAPLLEVSDLSRGTTERAPTCRGGIR